MLNNAFKLLGSLLYKIYYHLSDHAHLSSMMHL